MPGPVRSRIRPHAFERDNDVPTDYRGQSWCRWCRLPGKAGDERHSLDARPMLPPTPDDARALDARRLGERDDLEES